MKELQRQSDEVREEYASNATTDNVQIEDPPGSSRGGGGRGGTRRYGRRRWSDWNRRRRWRWRPARPATRPRWPRRWGSRWDNRRAGAGSPSEGGSSSGGGSPSGGGGSPSGGGAPSGTPGGHAWRWPVDRNAQAAHRAEPQARGGIGRRWRRFGCRWWWRRRRRPDVAGGGGQDCRPGTGHGWRWDGRTGRSANGGRAMGGGMGGGMAPMHGAQGQQAAKKSGATPLSRPMKTCTPRSGRGRRRLSVIAGVEKCRTIRNPSDRGDAPAGGRGACSRRSSCRRSWMNSCTR